MIERAKQAMLFTTSTPRLENTMGNKRIILTSIRNSVLDSVTFTLELAFVSREAVFESCHGYGLRDEVVHSSSQGVVPHSVIG
jgi:hypothetical protein